jgi:uncharacterized protein YkwD
MLHQGKLLALYLSCVIGTSSCIQNVPQDTPHPHNISAFEHEIFTEMNRARTKPAEYASYLEETKRAFDQKLPPVSSDGTTHVDASMQAYYEAIAFLKSSKSLPALELSSGMSSAARDHLRDQMQAATLGHSGSDGSTLADRINRYGSWEVGLGEAIVHGSSTAKRLVMQLVIDYDDPGRNHRINIFNQDLSVTGIACGNNVRYRNLCVITFAGKYVDYSAGKK